MDPSGTGCIWHRAAWSSAYGGHICSPPLLAPGQCHQDNLHVNLQLCVCSVLQGLSDNKVKGVNILLLRVTPVCCLSTTEYKHTTVNHLNHLGKDFDISKYGFNTYQQNKVEKSTGVFLLDLSYYE